MTKKQVKIVICVIQAMLVAMLFLPLARASGSNSALLNTMDLARRYSDMGQVYDSIVYIMLAGCSPVVTVLSLFLIHERRNFGVGACVCALTALVHACFYTSVKTTMAGTITVTGIHYLMVFLSFAGMAMEIYGYLLVGPEKGEAGKKTP